MTMCHRIRHIPYVVIGDDTSAQWDTDDTVGSENTLTLHVWSRYYGRAEVKDIMQGDICLFAS